MGKKKSVALIVVITIVLVALIFISVATFAIPSTVKIFNSLLSTVDLGTDLGGGYYTVYYPDGVISQDEYEMIRVQYEEAKNEGEDLNAYDNPEDYTKYKGVYLSDEITDEDGKVTESFQAEFDSAFQALQKRFEQKGFVDYSVKLQDDYTVLVQIPYTNESASDLFDQFAYSGSLIFSDTAEGTASKNVLLEGDSRYVKKASAAGNAESGYAVAVHFTKEGQSKFAEITGELVENASSSSTDGSAATAQLYMYVGSELLMSVQVDSAWDSDVVYISGSFETRESAETIACVINSTLDENNVFDLKLDASQIYRLSPTMGENAATILAIAIGVLILAMIVYSLVRYKGMGLAHVYGFLTYALIFILCISLIGGVYINMEGLMAIVLSAAIMVSLNWYAFKNIREEFATGKTLTAAIKAGYKRSLALTIDLHLVLLLASVVLMLISTGTVHFMAFVFLMGTVISAACTLAVTRFYFYMFLAQPKNKIAFCNFKREETEDE